MRVNAWRVTTGLVLRLRGPEAEGAADHLHRLGGELPENFRDPAMTLVVYTPAIPADSDLKNWFAGQGFTMVQTRSEIWATLPRKYVMAVAGTHGKTTTTTMLAWLTMWREETGRAALFWAASRPTSLIILCSVRARASRRGRRVRPLVPEAIPRRGAGHID